MTTLHEHITRKSLEEAAPFSTQIKQYLETLKAVFSKLIDMVKEGQVSPAHKPYLKMKLKQIVGDSKLMSNPVQVAKLFVDLKVPKPVEESLNEDGLGGRFLNTLADVIGMSDAGKQSVKNAAGKVMKTLDPKGLGGQVLFLRVAAITLILSFAGIFLNFFLKYKKLQGKVKEAIEKEVNPKLEILIDAIVDEKIGSQIALNSYFARIEEAVLFKYKDEVAKEPSLS